MFYIHIYKVVKFPINGHIVCNEYLIYKLYGLNLNLSVPYLILNIQFQVIDSSPEGSMCICSIYYSECGRACSREDLQ